MDAASVNPQEALRSALPVGTSLVVGREAKQGEIGVVIDGKYYGITDYAEE